MGTRHTRDTLAVAFAAFATPAHGLRCKQLAHGSPGAAAAGTAAAESASQGLPSAELHTPRRSMQTSSNDEGSSNTFTRRREPCTQRAACLLMAPAYSLRPTASSLHHTVRARTSWQRSPCPTTTPHGRHGGLSAAQHHTDTRLMPLWVTHHVTTPILAPCSFVALCSAARAGALRLCKASSALQSLARRPSY